MTLSRTSPVMRLIRTAMETTPAERTTLSCRPAASCASLRLAVLFKEVGNRHDPRIVVRQFVLFIRRVQTIVRQAESHEDGGDAEVFREVPDNRNRSSATDEHRFPSENVAKSA